MVKIVSLLAAMLFLFSGCGRIKDRAQDEKEKKLRKNSAAVQASLKSLRKEKDSAFESYVSSVSLREKVCQLFIENIEGDTVFVPVEKDFVPGGYLFLDIILRILRQV